jgi:uncharacterized protein YyaL (SSP411 family)
MTSEPKYTNRLIHETSPYLQQHAHNPVDWHPWGPEALDKARAEDKPILLSIGYSACHWCHVMEHESFEDEGTAGLMNAHYVNIKVDREERPDLDRIYQTAHQFLAQRPGGWPLTLVLSPDDHAPFFAGTYFPKEPRHGLPGFAEVLRRVHGHFRAQRDRLKENGAAFREAFAQIAPRPGDLRVEAIARAVRDFTEQYDPVYGGFGGAPKFPHPTSLELLVRHAARGGKGSDQSLAIVRHTLKAMAEGGLYDQLGGGFCRYSVDEKWGIPHFEKMLYDNAQLLPLYVQAWKATGEALFRRVAEETGEFLMREMQDADGGYYSSLDADSEGEEGRFYVWDRRELQTLLDDGEWAVVEAHYGLRGGPNFEGRWHLNVAVPREQLGERLGRNPAEVEDLLRSARRKMRVEREKRVRPGRDEKILASWNGLAIRAMALAGRLLERADLTASAERALDFAHVTLWRDGRLFATTRNGKTHLNGYLDDYAFLAAAALELLQARWRTEDLDFALALAGEMRAHFEDAQGGGFYFTADDHERLLHRHKPSGDDALPSGNAAAAQVFLALGSLLGAPEHLETARRTLAALAGDIERHPGAHAALCLALEDLLAPPPLLILRGPASELPSWLRAATADFAPRRQVFAVPDEAGGLSGILAQHRARGVCTATLCEGHVCREPMTSLEGLVSMLHASVR